jgi:RHS repeat-associated protein
VTSAVDIALTALHGIDSQQLQDGNGTTYTYDQLGNRTTQTTGGNSTTVTTLYANETTADGTWTYTYDSAGQRTQKSKVGESWQYAYDHDGHLIEVKKFSAANGGGSLVTELNYQYDAFGNRLSRAKYLNGSTTSTTYDKFVYDGWKTNQDRLGNDAEFVGNENWDVLADLTFTNALSVRRIYGNEVDQILAKTTAATNAVATWMMSDRQGSVRFLTSNLSSPTRTGTVTYDGFGKPLTSTGTADRYTYTGREYDADTAPVSGGAGTGLLHLRDRVLSNDLGRFLTRDRLGFDAGDLNLTRYVGNGYVNASDPSGYDYADYLPSGIGFGLAGLGASAVKKIPGVREEFNKRIEKGIENSKNNIESIREMLGDPKKALKQLDDDVRRAIDDPAQKAFGEIVKDISKELFDSEGKLNTDKMFEEAKASVQQRIQKAIEEANASEQKNRSPERDALIELGMIVAIEFGCDIAGEIEREWNTPDKPGSIGSSGFLTGNIPIYGSVRDTINHFQNGRHIFAAANLVLVVADVFGMKTAVKGVLKFGAGSGADSIKVMTRAGSATATKPAVSGAKIADDAAKAATATGKSTRSLDVLVQLGDACFAAGTMVRTPQGQQAIETLKPGDQVLSRDEHDHSGLIQPRTVEKVFETCSPILTLSLRGRTIRTTPEHPFFVQDRGWTAAKDLRAGMKLATDRFEWVEIDAVNLEEQKETVYNIRVEEHCTYFVGDESWGFFVWAHNRYIVKYENGKYVVVAFDTNIIRNRSPLR